MAKMTMKQFENSGKDVEDKKHGKEGSKQEQAHDRDLMKAKMFKKGGKVEMPGSPKMVSRGNGAAVKGFRKG